MQFTTEFPWDSAHEKNFSIKNFHMAQMYQLHSAIELKNLYLQSSLNHKGRSDKQGTMRRVQLKIYQFIRTGKQKKMKKKNRCHLTYTYILTERIDRLIVMETNSDRTSTENMKLEKSIGRMELKQMVKRAQHQVKHKVEELKIQCYKISQ